MPKNSLIFPNEFQLDGTASDSGIGALEIAINNLGIASKSGAMRQANAIRIGGLGSIKNQNRGMPTLNTLLPTRSVGRFTVTPSEPSGTVGYFIGGFGDNSSGQDISLQQRRLDRFVFATTLIVNLGSQINIHSAYSFGNTQYGYYCWAPGGSRFFGRFTFQTETTARTGSVIFPSRYQGASLKNQNRGYICAGISTSNGSIYGNVDRFSFAGEVCVSIATLLQVKNVNTAFGNKFNGYIGGGLTANGGMSVSNNIERFSYAAETTAIISAVFSSTRAMLPTWTPSSPSAAYVVSGYTYNSLPVGSAARGYSINTIDRFVFTGETCAALGVILVKGLRWAAAVGNNTRCILGGGISYSDSYETQSVLVNEVSEMRAINYATETHEMLGCTLSIGRYASIGLDNQGI